MARRDFFIIGLIFISVFSFLFITATISSGYHFTDDHEIIQLTRELSTDSIYAVTKRWVTRDLTIRLRPMYYFTHIITTKVLKDNIFVWSIYTGLLAVIVLSLFYLGIRRFKYSISEAIWFILISFLGPQLAIFWRLGPAETMGVFFLGLSFYSITNNSKRYNLNTFLFAVFLIAASLCKESFAIIVPAMVFLKLGYQKSLFNLSFKEVILKNLILIASLVIIFVILTIIVFINWHPGGNFIRNEYSLYRLLRDIYYVIKPLGNFIILLAVTGFVYFKSKNNSVNLNYLLKLILPIIFCALIIIPNFILYWYARSPMQERYLLPTTIGLAFLIVGLLTAIKAQSAKLSKYLSLVIIIFLILQGYKAFKQAYAFTKEGQQTNKFLSLIVDKVRDYPKVLLVVDPIDSYEWTISLDNYLSLKEGIKVYIYWLRNPLSIWYNTVSGKGMAQNLVLKFENRGIKESDWPPDRLIFLDNKLSAIFFSQNNIAIDQYKEIKIEDTPFSVWQRR